MVREATSFSKSTLVCCFITTQKPSVTRPFSPTNQPNEAFIALLLLLVAPWALSLANKEEVKRDLSNYKKKGRRNRNKKKGYSNRPSFSVATEGARLSCNPICGGDPIVDKHTVLVADLDCPSSESGLFLDGGVLDCAGFTIRGNGDSESFGVRLENGADMINCKIEGFDDCVSVAGAAVKIKSTFVTGCSFGVLILGGKEALLHDVAAIDNTSGGIFVRGDATLNGVTSCNDGATNGDIGIDGGTVEYGIGPLVFTDCVEVNPDDAGLCDEVKMEQTEECGAGKVCARYSKKKGYY